MLGQRTRPEKTANEISGPVTRDQVFTYLNATNEDCAVRVCLYHAVAASAFSNEEALESEKTRNVKVESGIAMLLNGGCQGNGQWW